MCFGLSLELDRESISTFLQLIGRPALAKTLASRLSNDEVQDLVHYLTGVLKNNMTEDEYHELFLLEQSPHTHK